MEKSDNRKGGFSEVVMAVVQETLEKMGFDAQVEIVGDKSLERDDEKKLLCNIKTQESSFLIGQHGVNLDSLQHIIRLLVRKRTKDEDEKVNFVIDVNSYRQERNSSIIELAKSLAAQAITEKRSVALRPMSSYERRIVHMELANNDQVETESVGEGENRKIVIKPVSLI